MLPDCSSLVSNHLKFRKFDLREFDIWCIFGWWKEVELGAR